MQIDSSWAFFLFCFCWVALMAGTVLGFIVGSRMGSKRERYRQAKEKIRNNKAAIYHYQKEKQAYLQQIDHLKCRMQNLTGESEQYKTQLSDMQYYQQKVQESERLIQDLSSENTSLKDQAFPFVPKPKTEVLSLLLQLKEDPTHTNLSRSEWEELIRMTDVLFNNFLSVLIEKAAITRHEQEICCLIKWNFSRREQMAVFNNTTDALTKSKSRLKKRLQLDEKTDLDQYVRLC